MWFSKRPLLEENTQCVPSNSAIKNIPVVCVDYGEVRVRCGHQNIVHNADLLNGAYEDDVRAHDLTGNEIVIVLDGIQLCLEELDPLFQVDMNVVQIIVEDHTNKAG